MKTTLEIADPLLRKVKSKAAERGQTLKEFVSEALQQKLGDKERLACERYSVEGVGRSGRGDMAEVRMRVNGGRQSTKRRRAMLSAVTQRTQEAFGL